MKIMKNLTAAALLFAVTSLAGHAAQIKEIVSPNGTLHVQLQQSPLGWTVTKNGTTLYTMKNVNMQIGGKNFAGNTPFKSVKTTSAKETIKPVVPIKFSTVESAYTQATLSYGNYTVEMRVMDNAVAYRFVTKIKGNIEVQEDNFTLVPAEGYVAHRQTTGNFNTSYEEAYRHETLEQWNQSDRKLSTIPCLLSGPNDSQLLMGEADVDDYPRLFLQPTTEGIEATYPKAPVKWEPRGDRSEKITEEGNFIAKTAGTRTFPWRYVACTDSKGIVEQTITLQLSRKPVLTDTSWIKPGQVSWEWWNGAAPFGPDVDFVSGCNYETYAYFADFAAKYGVEYILLDEGWAKDTRDPYTANDDMRLKDLIQYCKSKGVGVILWLPWLTVEKNWDLFKKYAEWGVAGVKIDFMDHADQWMVNFYKRVVSEAAKYKLLVDLHGSFTPAGLEYEYPNFLSYEGIRGLEQMGSCRPENTTYLPFIRNAVGPADFTPGGMNNMQPDRYHASRPNSGAMGTRCFQMALYVVLESGIQMLADNPTRYYQNDDCTRYIASVPTTWDETRCLAAEAGKYVITAKRKGNKWFIGGICNGDEDARTFSLKLDFLGAGNHTLTAYKDGVNANWQAMHYNKEQRQVNATTTLDIKMMKNGGYAAVIE